MLVTEPREAAELWPNHNRWLETVYLRPSPRSVVELTWSSLLLSVVAWQAIDAWAGVIAYFGAWFTAFGLWWAFEVKRMVVARR